jgi:hypothetical protein
MILFSYHRVFIEGLAVGLSAGLLLGLLLAALLEYLNVRGLRADNLRLKRELRDLEMARLSELRKTELGRVLCETSAQEVTGL